MGDATIRTNLELNPVDIYIQPPVRDIDMLDFHKAEEIYEQGLAAKDDFKRQLEALLEKPRRRRWFGRRR